jgi:hypothetical protein
MVGRSNLLVNVGLSGTQGEKIMTGFDKLRLAATKTVAIAAVAAGLSMAPASAVPVSINNYEVKAAGATWTLSSSSYAHDTYSNTSGFVVQTAHYDGRGVNYFWLGHFVVNGTAYVSPTGKVEYTTTVNGSTVVGPEQKISEGKLATKTEVFFSKKAPVARAILSVRNTSGSPQKVKIQSGHYQNGYLLASSNGNTTFESAQDRYLVDSDVPANQAFSKGDLVTYYRFGSGAVTKPVSSLGQHTLPNNSGADDYWSDIYQVTIPAGQTVRIMEIVRINGNSTSKAVADAKDSKFNTLGTLLGAGYLADYNIANVFTILNWKF